MGSTYLINNRYSADSLTLKSRCYGRAIIHTVSYSSSLLQSLNLIAM